MVCLIIHTAANQGGSGNGGSKQVFGFGHGRVSSGSLGKSGIIAAVRRRFGGCFGERAGICARLGAAGQEMRGWAIRRPKRRLPENSKPVFQVAFL